MILASGKGQYKSSSSKRRLRVDACSPSLCGGLKYKTWVWFHKELDDPVGFRRERRFFFRCNNHSTLALLGKRTFRRVPREHVILAAADERLVALLVGIRNRLLCLGDKG